jgi:hypothetical protein
MLKKRRVNPAIDQRRRNNQGNESGCHSSCSPVGRIRPMADRTDSSRGEPVIPARLGLSEILLAIWVSAAR